MYGFRPESRSVEDPRRSESAVHLDRIDIVLLKLLDDPDDDLSPRAPRFAIGVGLGGLIQGEGPVDLGPVREAPQLPGPPEGHSADRGSLSYFHPPPFRGRQSTFFS